MASTSGGRELWLRSSVISGLHVRGDFPKAGHDLFEMFEVGDIEDDLHAGLAVFCVGTDVADVALCVANDAGDILQHPELVVAINRQLYRVSRWRAVVTRPLHVDAALRFVHQVRDVRAIHRPSRLRPTGQHSHRDQAARQRSSSSVGWIIN